MTGLPISRKGDWLHRTVRAGYRSRGRPYGSRDCCPPTTLTKLQPVSHLRSPMRAGGTSSRQPVRPPSAGSGATLRLWEGVPGYREGTGRGASGGCAALASCSVFPHLHLQRGDSDGSDDAEQRWKEDRKPTSLLSPQRGTDPGGNSARVGRLSSVFALRHLAKSHRAVQLLAQRGHGASPATPGPAGSRIPSLACNPSGRGGQPETPGHPPTLSCGRGIEEGEEGGGGGGRAVAGRRGQPGLRCSRRPGTTDGGGERGGREGGSEGGGRARRREGGMEGREEGGRSASLRERCTAPFKGAETRFLYGCHRRLPTPPSLAGARRPPMGAGLPPRGLVPRAPTRRTASIHSRR